MLCPALYSPAFQHYHLCIFRRISLYESVACLSSHPLPFSPSWLLQMSLTWQSHSKKLCHSDCQTTILSSSWQSQFLIQHPSPKTFHSRTRTGFHISSGCPESYFDKRDTSSCLAPKNYRVHIRPLSRTEITACRTRNSQWLPSGFPVFEGLIFNISVFVTVSYLIVPIQVYPQNSQVFNNVALVKRGLVHGKTVLGWFYHRRNVNGRGCGSLDVYIPGVH